MVKNHVKKDGYVENKNRKGKMSKEFAQKR